MGLHRAYYCLLETILRGQQASQFLSIPNLCGCDASIWVAHGTARGGNYFHFLRLYLLLVSNLAQLKSRLSFNTTAGQLFPCLNKFSRNSSSISFKLSVNLFISARLSLILSSRQWHSIKRLAMLWIWILPTSRDFSSIMLRILNFLLNWTSQLLNHSRWRQNRRP